MAGFNRLNRQRTAIHEAAHAVMMRVFSFPLESVTINLGADGSGGLTSAPDTGGYSLLDIERAVLMNKAIVALAGPIGQDLLIEQRIRQHPSCTPGHAEILEQTFHEGNRFDYEHAEQIAIVLVGQDCGDTIGYKSAEATKMLAKLEHKTRKKIEKHRQAIGRVAEALLAQGALSSAEVDQIINGT